MGKLESFLKGVLLGYGVYDIAYALLATLLAKNEPTGALLGTIGIFSIGFFFVLHDNDKAKERRLSNRLKSFIKGALLVFGIFDLAYAIYATFVVDNPIGSSVGLIGSILSMGWFFVFHDEAKKEEAE